METLGIATNVQQLFSNVGWEKFMSLRCSTYAKLTLEFLSSVEFVDETENDEEPKHTLYFRMLNTDQELSLYHLCEAFGLVNDGETYIPSSRVSYPEDIFHSHRFWGQLTNENFYNASSAKASHIQNPVFRYIQKVMAITLFGRGDNAVVRLTELFILWHMVNTKPVNAGYFLAQHLSRHATQPAGNIVVGGMVTAIVDYLGLTQSIADLTPVSGSMKLDLEACMQCRMLKPVERGYQLLINGQLTILLPDPARTDIENRANWLYDGRGAGNNVVENEHVNVNVVEEQQEGGIPDIQQDEVMVENAPADMPLWMERFSRFEEEQKRQGEVLNKLSTMMSALYTQYSAQPPSDQ